LNIPAKRRRMGQSQVEKFIRSQSKKVASHHCA